MSFSTPSRAVTEILQSPSSASAAKLKLNSNIFLAGCGSDKKLMAALFTSVVPWELVMVIFDDVMSNAPNGSLISACIIMVSVGDASLTS